MTKSKILACVSLGLLSLACGGDKTGDEHAGTGTGVDTGDEANDTETNDTETNDTEANDTEASDTTDGSDECPSSCETPEVLADGVVRCSDGAINREEPGTFEAIITAPACDGNEDLLYCSTDSDCFGGLNPKCIRSSTFDDEGAPISSCTCAYTCATDSDCAPGQACIPPDVLPGTPNWPTCKTAACTRDTDCGPCGQCGMSARHENCSWVIELACRTAEDSCRADSDCPETCAPIDGTWECFYGPCDADLQLLRVKP
jgi:hypothetical protein